VSGQHCRSGRAESAVGIRSGLLAIKGELTRFNLTA
jgi:hypothetical protein